MISFKNEIMILCKWYDSISILYIDFWDIIIVLPKVLQTCTRLYVHYTQAAPFFNYHMYKWDWSVIRLYITQYYITRHYVYSQKSPYGRRPWVTTRSHVTLIGHCLLTVIRVKVEDTSPRTWTSFGTYLYSKTNILPSYLIR